MAVLNFPLPITRVRWTGTQADILLEAFVDGGRLAGRRPPRGIHPEQVSRWIVQAIQADCAPGIMMRAAQTIRFYECRDVIDHLRRFLTRDESDARSFGRSMQILQVMGDVGLPEHAAFAAAYFKDVLLPLPVVMDNFALVLETAEALAITVDLKAIEGRLTFALDAARQVGDLDGAAGGPWRKYSDYQRNNYPNTIVMVESKRYLVRSGPEQRLEGLIQVYLGESPVSGPAMETWSGRLIRAHANTVDTHAAVIKAAVSWLVCDTACIGEEADVEIKLPIAKPADVPARSPDAKKIDDARARLPRDLAPDSKDITISWSASEFNFKIIYASLPSSAFSISRLISLMNFFRMKNGASIRCL